jgi:CDP-paratose 2-epimerase
LEAEVSVAIVTGSAGLIGSECSRKFASEGLHVVGIDNDMRAKFFGPEASTRRNRMLLERDLKSYEHSEIDIRDYGTLEKLFARFRTNIKTVLHTAAQPSHDWAASEPLTDFGINATGTLNLLEVTRKYCPDAVFVFTSTNKVYGDIPNSLPFIEEGTRYELALDHPYYDGIDETMPIDQSKHSVFGVSKAAADLMVQEYGRYFGMKTGTFRGGCLTGPAHTGAELHGFLAYLMKCTVKGKPYRTFGYKGKQVRDNIHSCDLANAFWEFVNHPGVGKVYNIGGGRHAHCSVLEAIALCEKIAGRKLNWSYIEENRSGDHIWWVSSVKSFQADYPNWRYRYGLDETLREIHAACVSDS